MKRLLFLALVFVAGCTTPRTDSERAREVALQYLGGDAGTAGPFFKHQKKELDILSPKDRSDAIAWLDRGAVAFVVYEARAGGTTRAVLVMDGRVVGDYRAPAEQKQK